MAHLQMSRNMAFSLKTLNSRSTSTVSGKSISKPSGNYRYRSSDEWSISKTVLDQTGKRIEWYYLNLVIHLTNSSENQLPSSHLTIVAIQKIPHIKLTQMKMKNNIDNFLAKRWPLPRGPDESRAHINLLADKKLSKSARGTVPVAKFRAYI